MAKVEWGCVVCSYRNLSSSSQLCDMCGSPVVNSSTGELSGAHRSLPSRSVPEVLEALGLGEFSGGIVAEGFQGEADLLEMSDDEARACCGNAGMRMGHTIRFLHWLRACVDRSSGGGGGDGGGTGARSPLGRPLEAIMGGLSLLEFQDPLEYEGFQHEAHLRDLTETEARVCAANVGMKQGHTIRFLRWLRTPSLDGVHSTMIAGGGGSIGTGNRSSSGSGGGGGDGWSPESARSSVHGSSPPQYWPPTSSPPLSSSATSSSQISARHSPGTPAQSPVATVGAHTVPRTAGAPNTPLGRSQWHDEDAGGGRASPLVAQPPAQRHAQPALRLPPRTPQSLDTLTSQRPGEMPPYSPTSPLGTTSHATPHAGAALPPSPLQASRPPVVVPYAANQRVSLSRRAHVAASDVGVNTGAGCAHGGGMLSSGGSSGNGGNGNCSGGVVRLADLRMRRAVPLELRCDHYWDCCAFGSSSGFAHVKLLRDAPDVVSVVDNLASYIASWLHTDAASAALGHPVGPFHATGSAGAADRSGKGVHLRAFLRGEASPAATSPSLGDQRPKGPDLGRLHYLEEFINSSRPKTGGRLIEDSYADGQSARIVGCVEYRHGFHPEVVIGSQCPGGAHAHAAAGGRGGRREAQPFALGQAPTLFVGVGVSVLGGVFDLSRGSIYLGAGTVVEPGAHLVGPCIVGRSCMVRHGAYLRGDVLLGDGVVVRCEMKNALAMDHAELCHPGYVGDSIVGFGAHFGCHALTANLPMLGGPGTTVVVEVSGLRVDLGRRKLGVIMGDGCQLGCNSVTEPGCLMGKRTMCYPLTRLPKGVYGPNELIKNKPMEHGVIERAPLVE